MSHIVDYEPSALMHQSIDQLEALMRQSDSVIDVEPTHIFAPGLYLREVRLAAGTLATGRIHKTEHPSIISQGTLIYVGEQGPVVMSAPCVVMSPPGVRRVVMALTDVVWTCVHPNPENIRDVAELEKTFLKEQQ